tara:strand:- start:15957 stop:19235 length:3279 start_codon:yes stop_codon:yes gene_type:complete
MYLRRKIILNGCFLNQNNLYFSIIIFVFLFFSYHLFVFCRSSFIIKYMSIKPFLVYKSSAGSGKTYALSKNYIRLALKSTFYFKRILAVTFTNKAAEEMKSRILEMIDDIKKGKDKQLIIEFSQYYNVNYEEIIERARKLQTSLIHNYSYFSISTIDTFFYGIIQSFTRDLKFRGVFNIEMDHELVINEVVARFLSDLEKGSPISRWLTEFSRERLSQKKDFLVVQEIKNIAKNLFSEEYKALAPKLKNANYVKDVKGLKAHIYQTRKEFKLEVVLKAKKIYDSILLNNFSVEDFSYKSSGVAGFIFKSSSGVIVEPGIRIMNCLDSSENWISKSFDRKHELEKFVEKELMVPFKELISIYKNGIVSYNTASELNNYLYAFGILGELYKKVIDYRDENEVILISDLSELLKEIISNDNVPFIFEKVGNRFSNFLIDEFQDTSLFQWENFKPLIHDSLSSGDENLIVGDIKQSIYRWRGSQSTIMQKRIHDDMDSKLISVNYLKNNWRSAEVIVNFNNIFFSEISKIFSEKKICSELKKIYNDELIQEVIQEKKNKGFVQVKFNLSTKTFHEAGVCFTLDTIRHLQDLGSSPGDIGIIVRNNKEAKIIAEALLLESLNKNSKYNYNHVSADALDIKSTSIVRFFISIFRYFINSKDRLALSEIVYFYCNKVKKSENISHFVFTNDDKLKKLPKEFYRDINTISRLPIYEMVERIIRIFKLNGLPDQIPYLQSFQDLVLEFKRNNDGDLISFLKWWEENNNKTLEISEQIDAISLITIHKSKGLEFENVIIPFCDWKLDHDTKGSKNKFLWVDLKKLDSNFEFPFPLKYKSKHPNTIYLEEFYREKIRAYNDNINLLYVALTRPRSALFIHSRKKGSLISNVSDVLYKHLENKLLEKKDFMLYESGNLIKKEHSSIHKKSYVMESYISSPWNGRVRIKKTLDEFITSEKQKDLIERGKKIHNILYHIKSFNDLEEGLNISVNKNIIVPSERKDFKCVLNKILKNKEIKPFFNPDKKSNNEIEVLDKNGEVFRLDRVVEIEKNHLVVLDYKTGKEEGYHREQVINYKNLLKSLHYKNVSGYLIYLDSNKLISVND